MEKQNALDMPQNHIEDDLKTLEQLLNNHYRAIKAEEKAASFLTQWVCKNRAMIAGTNAAEAKQLIASLLDLETEPKNEGTEKSPIYVYDADCMRLAIMLKAFMRAASYPF